MSETQESIVVIGAGFTGLMCALEAQRKLGRRVEIVTQVYPSDPPPMRWTTGYSCSYYGCIKTAPANFEQQTRQYLLDSTKSNPRACFQFRHNEYFSAESIPTEKLLDLPEFQTLDRQELIEGSNYGASFVGLSTSADYMAREMLLEFARNGGRILRGTVRHIREIVEGGIGAFARPIDGELCKPPAAIVVCAGIGARFIGGIEDTTVFPVRNEVVKLRAPWITMGKAAYDQNLDISVFVVPLGDGDVVIGGHATINDWYPKPRPITVKHLLEKAATLCPELLTPPGDERVPDIQSLVVWEGCDIFGNRRDGPRLDVEWHSAPDFKRKIPVVMNYGYGKAELRAFKGIADAAIRLVDAALAQQMEQIETTS